MTIAVRLTPRALEDLDAIADYTIENWGLAQMGDYLHTLNNRFDWLAENPLAGHDRGDIHPGYRSFPQGSHIIFYLVSDDSIDIIGIPHKSMDIGPELLT